MSWVQWLRARIISIDSTTSSKTIAKARDSDARLRRRRQHVAFVVVEFRRIRCTDAGMGCSRSELLACQWYMSRIDSCFNLINFFKIKICSPQVGCSNATSICTFDSRIGNFYCCERKHRHAILSTSHERRRLSSVDVEHATGYINQLVIDFKPDNYRQKSRDNNNYLLYKASTTSTNGLKKSGSVGGVDRMRDNESREGLALRFFDDDE